MPATYGSHSSRSAERPTAPYRWSRRDQPRAESTEHKKKNNAVIRAAVQPGVLNEGLIFSHLQFDTLAVMITMNGLCNCFIILLLITHHSSQQTGNSDPFACEDEEATAMCNRAQIPGEQHFHKVYLGCYMQSQGLLIDMINLAAGGKKEHIILRQSDPTSILSNQPICLMLGTTNDHSNGDAPPSY
ncbi:hypothetical protein PAMP_018687 [Pampus punctatissimus]